jgi:DNA-binding IclR family transcriptional regulator
METCSKILGTSALPVAHSALLVPSRETTSHTMKRRATVPRVTRVVERVGSILDAFTLEHPELTLTECAQAAALNKSSVYRLLSSLEEVGLVERVDLRWRLGAKVVQLSEVRLGRIELRQEAVRHLRELRKVFRAAVAFSVPEGSHMIYLERYDSPDS